MYLRPQTIGEACTALASGPASLLSGGTDFYPALGERRPPDRIVDLSRVHELRGIAIDREHVRIGATTTWTALSAADLPPCFDGL